MTLAEKIEAVVREAFPCPVHAIIWCRAHHRETALAACHRAANLAIEGAATCFNSVERLLILGLKLPEDKGGKNG